ncbi:hypothetical protein Tco_1405020 [Tanacetum coccineum]
MLAIFHDMIEESIEVFMDVFSVFGNSFDNYLNNLDKMLQRCKDANLVLNWEKCHFMVKEGIVLRYKVSSADLEVDKTKINVISKVPPPTNVKGIRSFLGHAVIRVKQKQLNLGVGTERIIFHIDSTMKHSYSNDDTCFSIDVIDEILKEDFDALLDEENSESDSDKEEQLFEKITFHTDYKIKTSLEEPPTDLELKSFPENLEYVFLEEPYFLHLIISSQLSKQDKDKLIFVPKCHKQAFAWKTTDIREGIVLRHKVSSADLEVDKAKINVISKVPPPTNVKGIRSFLGHAGFY